MPPGRSPVSTADSRTTSVPFGVRLPHESPPSSSRGSSPPPLRGSTPALPRISSSSVVAWRPGGPASRHAFSPASSLSRTHSVVPRPSLQPGPRGPTRSRWWHSPGRCVPRGRREPTRSESSPSGPPGRGTGPGASVASSVPGPAWSLEAPRRVRRRRGAPRPGSGRRGEGGQGTSGGVAGCVADRAIHTWSRSPTERLPARAGGQPLGTTHLARSWRGSPPALPR